MNDRPRVIAVTGPTASGKTALGVLLAERLDGEIVSVDSMQLYRGMEIGTAAPTMAERRGIPHHMIGVAEPGEAYSVARYVTEADACVRDILARGKRPILVGGTGLYLDALIRGNTFAPSDGAVRRALYEQLAQTGIEPLFRELEEVDPETAARLHRNDEKRILRALEVFRESGKPLSQHDRETRAQPDRYDAVVLALAFEDREEMKRLIDRRVEEMVARGLPDEVRRLMERLPARDATAWQAIGYKEFLAVADGGGTQSDAIEEVKLRSRQYAKRQLTWLRRKPDIHWLLWGKERDFASALQKATEILTAEGLS